MPDLVTIGETMAAFIPESGLPIQKAPGFHMRIAGAESNTAIGVARLGHFAGWISRLGDDSFGEYILETLQKEGVDTSRTVTDALHSTGIMFKQPNQENATQVYYYRDNSAATFLSASSIDYDYLTSAKVLHVTGITPILSQSCMECINKAIDIAHDNRILVSFDPNIRLKLWRDKDYRPLLTNLISRSNIVLLGLSEASVLYETDDIQQITDLIFSHPRVQYVAVKNGALGAWVCTRDERHFVDPIPCNCIEPVGAGDGFNAGFIHGILENRDIKTCGLYGGIAGALATETYGDTGGYPTLERLQQMEEKYG